MPSSYTTSLRLTLPATGELAGQWGNTVNTGITELLDAAVAGTASISTWGGAGVAYTLSNNSGTADEARKMFIVATGSPGEAKNVICPAVSKFYVFRNDTTGGFALTLKTSGGTGIAVPAGQYKFLYCDGTNVVEMFNSAGALTLSGALSVGGTTTLASNPTLSAGTANGVLYLNGSKVATSGSALSFNGTTFTNSAGLVQAAGLISLPTGGEGGQLSLQDTTGTSNIYTFDVESSNQGRLFTTVNNTNLSIGQLSGTGGQVILFAGGSEGLRLDASRNLLIGGTAGPNYQVTVTGTGQETANLTDAGNKGGSIYVRAAGIGAGSGGAVLFGTTFGNQTPFAAIKGFVTDGSTNTKGDLAFSLRGAVGDTALSEQMRLTSTGLGIGTSSPGYKLSVNGAASGTVANIGYNGDLGTGFYIGVNHASNLVQLYASGSANKSMAFYTGATEVMRYDISGNLGLGVTPSAWGNVTALQLAKTSASNINGALYQGAIGANNAGGIAYNALYNGTTWQYIFGTSHPASRYEQAQGTHAWYIAGASTGTISFTQAMTLHASGGLSIGSTADPGANNIGIAAGGKLYYSTNAWITPEDNVIGARIAGSAVVGFWTGGTERARITSGGDLLVGDTATAAFFDGRLNVAGRIHNKMTAVGDANYVWNQATSGDNQFFSFGTEAAYTARGSITYNRAGGLVAYNTTSDYRAKDIIGPVQNPGATIDALKVYEGKMKGATQSRPMLIAHEAQAVAPYAVTGVKDEVNEDGTPKFQQMDVSSLVPLLLAEIQSLRARVAALEAQP